MAFTTIQDSQAIQFDSSGESVRLERAARDSRGQENELFLSQPALTEQLARPIAEHARGHTSAIERRDCQGGSGSRPLQVQNIISSWGDVSVFSRDGQEELLVQGMVDKAKRQLECFAFC